MISEQERSDSILNLWTERIELLKRKIWAVDIENPKRRDEERRRMEDHISQVDQALARLGVSR